MKARPPFDASCDMPCSIIAAGSGRNARSTPIRIMPPAMPRMPEMNAVTSVEAARTENTSAVLMAAHSARGGYTSKMTLLSRLMRFLHEDRYARRAGVHRHRRPRELQPRRRLAARYADGPVAPRAEPRSLPRREAHRAHDALGHAHAHRPGLSATGAPPAHRPRERARRDPRERQGVARRCDDRMRAHGRRALSAGHRARIRAALSDEPRAHPRPFFVRRGCRGAAARGRVRHQHAGA